MKEMFNKKRLFLTLIVICFVGLICVGVSHAYYIANFQIKKPENGDNNVTSASTTNVVMDINNKNVVFDEVLPGHKEVKAFTIRGEGDKNAQPTEVAIKIIPKLGIFSDDVTWTLYKSTEEVTCTSIQKHENNQYYEDSLCNIPSIATLEMSGGSSEKFKNVVVYPKTETKYYLVVEYANREEQNNQQGESYSISLDLAGKHISPTDKIIAQLDTTGNCPTMNSDYSINVTGLETNNGYLCKAKDDYGDSYYYRGNVTNNYVKFANKYWRIVRINGDDTVRVIYDGTSAHANGESSSDRQIGTSTFNDSNNDNAYVGYMYGKARASSYAEAHANINDSNIKKYLDNWYKNNILGTSYEQYLADNLFCNDRSISASIPYGYSNLGYSTEMTAYRWYYGTTYNPNKNENLYERLMCAQKNDAFTVSDIVNGNGALTYPIGLLSTDEIIIAGGWTVDNRSYYLYSGQYYWSISPISFVNNIAYERIVYSNGHGFGNNPVSGNHGVRPALNLKPDVLLQGTGTATDPYHFA